MVNLITMFQQTLTIACAETGLEPQNQFIPRILAVPRQTEVISK